MGRSQGSIGSERCWRRSERNKAKRTKSELERLEASFEVREVNLKLTGQLKEKEIEGERAEQQVDHPSSGARSRTSQ